MPVKRGEIYFVYLDPVFGHEMGGYKPRPVVVLSINDINDQPLVVAVVPGTTATGKPLRFRNVVVVSPNTGNGLTADTIFRCDQIRAIDKGRFTGRPIGRLSAKELNQLEEGVRYSLGLL